MNDPLAESKVAESANAAANAQQAKHEAYEAQLHETLVNALREVLVDGESEERPMLIKRIPFICKDIIDMKDDIKDISGNIKWGVRSVITAIIVGAVALFFK